MAGATPPSSSNERSPRWLLVMGALAAWVLFGAFLIGAFALFPTESMPGRNWLIVLFDLNWRPSLSASSALGTFSLLDLVLMLLFGLLMAAMYPTLSGKNKAWAAIAVALPFLGAAIFIATSIAGRSAVLLAALISATLALRSRFGSQLGAAAGILASVLLLIVGDFGTAALPPSALIGFLIAIGYLLWTAWLFLLAMEMGRRARIAAA